MKNLNFLFLLLFAGKAFSQPVAKAVLAEHFTNTYCSICSFKNPPLYNNMSMHPGVLHIAYHPSSPYPACPLNMHNVGENDARANFYGVYGGTPRLVMQGVSLVASTSFADPAIFTSVAGQTTAFSVRVAVAMKGSDSVTTTVSIKKEDASSLTTLGLYGALVEDTIFVAAANGEPGSYDVFRKAVWGADPISVAAPAAIGDSVTYTGTVALRTEWAATHMYAMCIVQASDKQLIQARRSGNLQPSTAMPGVAAATRLSLKPNPANSLLEVCGISFYPARIVIYDAVGRVCREQVLTQAGIPVEIGNMAAGAYLLRLDGETTVLKFTVQ